MLDDDLRSQLRAYFQKIVHPIEIVASLDDSSTAAQMRELLTEVTELSTHISLRTDGTEGRRPSFDIRRTGADIGVTFAAIPLGHELTSLILALLQVGGHPPKIDDETAQRIKSLKGTFEFETYISLSCHNCPDVVQALNAMSVLNPNIRHVTIDGALFQQEVADRGIMAVPTVRLNGQTFGQGRMGVDEIMAKLDTGAAERDAARLNEKAPYDMLIVGGGPAGAAAAVYAARKGIRTGVVAERFGGQTLDTLGIENFVSVLHTEGPQFATALEQHVKQYEVDVMNLQRAAKLVPEGNMITVELANGAALKSRSVILATGARWREVNVPGEAQYKNAGVAYCPHCDGPLFKGKAVAVIGGGNSGVEAAIDLAGVVAHVTLLEFAEQLRADAVLVNKLKSLPNVRILTQAQTTEITGDGKRVNGLVYTDRATGESHRIDLAGVFVQIGLVPNTEWLKGTIEMTRYGEIIVDDHGKTSVPGVYAAGDATTVPFKQIIIAAGDGARAALGAFDYLIRQT